MTISKQLIDLPDSIETTSNGYSLLYYEVDCRQGLLGSETPVNLSPKQFTELDEVTLGPLLSLFRTVFNDYFDEIEFGPVISGTVYELRIRQKPASMNVHDGYITVAFGKGLGHFHLCCGQSDANDGIGRNDRRIERAAIYRGLDAENRITGTGGIRCWNSSDQQMINIFLRGLNGPRIIDTLIERYCAVPA